MIKPTEGYLIVKDQKQEQKGGLLKTNSQLHQDKFVAEVIYVCENCKYKVGDIIIYDGLRGEEFPKVGDIKDDLIIIKENDILCLID